MQKDTVLATNESYSLRWWAFGVLALSILIVVIDHTILNVALPTIQSELGATIAELQWIVDAYILAFATLLLTMGTLSDRLGRANMLRAGMLVFGIASLAATFAGSAWQIVLARIFMGTGAAMIMPSTLAIITNIFPDNERGKAIAIWGAMNGLGVALGPLLGGLLLEHLDWNSVFFINVPIVIAALIAGYFLIPNSIDQSARRIDIPGTLLSALALSVLVFGLIKGSDWGWTHPAVLGSIAAATVCAVFFVLNEKRSAAPMLDPGLFSNHGLAAGSICIIMMTIAMFGTLFAFTLYMQCVKGYSALETGIRFLPLALGYATGSILSNRAVRLKGTRFVVTAGFLGMAVFALPIAFWQSQTPYWQIGLMLFIISFAMGNIMTPSLNALLGAVPKARAGIGSALGNASFQLGGALGVAALGSVLSSIYRTNMASSLASLPSLPANISAAAIESIGAAVRAVMLAPEGVRSEIIAIASRSFMQGWQMVMLSICIIGLAGALLAFKTFKAARG